MPAVAKATRIVTNRESLADEIGDYRPQDQADMESGGVQAFYDPITGETTIFPKDIELGEGETPLRAVARIILHERPARNLLEMISAKPLYLDTKKGRNWLRIAGKQYAGTRGFQSGHANVPNEAGVVNLAKSQAPRPSLRPPAAARPHLLSRPPGPDRTDLLVLLQKLHLPPSPASGPARKPKAIRISPSVPGATSNMGPAAPFLAHSTSSMISPLSSASFLKPGGPPCSGRRGTWPAMDHLLDHLNCRNPAGRVTGRPGQLCSVSYN
jgi:hypothetical protein